ncbi:MAG: response regulator [Calditrichae bacterium]|nr:response regulator [Calditrichota bacterium]MCB9058856.1 response regulator [Calditrichia bacterium]
MNKNKFKILFIEDDEEDFFIFKSIISDIDDFDSETEWCSNCDDGELKIKENNYDICFLDYQLGSCNGLEFLHRINAINNNTPFILLTGQHNKEIDIKAMEAGASDYIIKDKLDAFILEQAIRHAIERKKYQSQLLELTNELAIALREIRDNQKNLIEMENLRSVRQLAGAVAHEFSQPLQALTNYISLIKASGRIEPFAGKAELMVSRIAGLTENLRNITSLSKKKYVDTQILDLKKASAKAEPQNIRILVVDDESSVLESLTELLKIHGFDCDGANGGFEAIRMIAENDYKIIISDVSMPDVSGTDLFRHLKDNGQKFRFVFLTAYEVPENEKNIVDEADALLRKPFSDEHFIDIIKQLAI